jgi:hypothetical protein
MERSLKIHKNLINNKKYRSTRFIELIADFTNGYSRNWWFCVPSFFYEALDIKLTERVVNNKRVYKLTQGSNYNFTTGDTFYNHAYPYCKDFLCINQPEQPQICIQIQSATPCIQESENNQRNPGSVSFKILINRGKNQSECSWETIGFKTLTQDEFIELLIKGIPPEWINKKQPNLW